LDAVKKAHVKFQQANDTKAVAIMALVYTSSQPEVVASGQVCSLAAKQLQI